MVVSYSLKPNGEFCIENYNAAKPLANFFPGIAGPMGTPMWVFYVNRGQAISSFGIDGKDSAILEFQPANKAWEQTSLTGFRTFIKVLGAKEAFYEPFQDGLANRPYAVSNRLAMTSSDLRLEESNKTLKLDVSVSYFTIPQDSFAALVRTVTIKNTSRSSRTLQMLDGLPRIVPYGINNWCLKEIHRTLEAWMRVENLNNNVPFYKIDVDPGDRPQVMHIKAGNFFMGFHYQGKKASLIKPIVDPDAVFGEIGDLSCPRRFLAEKKFRYPAQQQIMCKTPCGFLLMDLELAPGGEKTFFEVIGYARDIEVMKKAATKVVVPGYLAAKFHENRAVIEGLQKEISTQTSSWEYDYYCKQTYLDNIMRGGWPMIFGGGRQPTPFYLYSRKHGDLERDYNRFSIQPSYFSQGNGNYRDINQNRRCDVWFNPLVRDLNIVTFMNLLQTDGHNPLVVKGHTFTLREVEAFRKAAAAKVPSDDMDKLIGLVSKKFTPGDVAVFIEDNGITLTCSTEDLLHLLLPLCERNAEAEFGEGYWIDHWHYNIDLLESFLAVYPDQFKEALFEKKHLTFYDSDACVRPRSQKYVLLDGVPKQLHSVYHDDEKKRLISSRSTLAHASRSDYGKGEIYYTTVINKLVCVFANKMASLDPFGCGVEMDSDKPNWYDALNGLPALFGSSVCETFEVKRLAHFLKDVIASAGVDSIAISDDVVEFVQGLAGLVEAYLASSDDRRDFIYWDKATTLKESYRKKTRLGLSGKEQALPVGELIKFLQQCIEKLADGLERSKNNGIYTGYFINEVSEFDMDGSIVKPKAFVQKPVVPFLEGQMHGLRLAANPQEAAALYNSTRKSPLYDKKLGMYKVTSSLDSMPEEIGRCRAFTPGWLENESVFLHMEYKYLLEVLKQGLYAEFFADMRKALIPFQDPARYGRSILENASFIVSSAFPNQQLHGNGFVARLSGSTVEFLNMWLLMNCGKQPFFVNERKELNLRFSPILPKWMFDAKTRSLSFTFVGTIPVTYRNPKMKDTFGSGGVKPVRMSVVRPDGRSVSFEGDTLPKEYALLARTRQLKSVEIELG